MATAANPDPRKDPRYADLYEKPKSFVDTFLAAYADEQNRRKADMQMEGAELALEDKRDKYRSRTALTEALMSADPENYEQVARQEFIRSGNVEGLMSMENTARQRDSSASLQEQRQLQQVQNLAKLDPKLAMEYWNATLSRKYGMKNDPSIFAGEPDYKSGAGAIYHIDPATGKPVIDYQQPERDPAPLRPSWQEYVDDQGNIQLVDYNSEADRRRIQSGGIKPYKKEQPSLFDQLLAIKAGGEKSTAEAQPNKRRNILVPK